MGQLTVYRASAGSGKTFTLAVEYIALLMADPTAYRNILAVTFTNKATAEMKERILSQLYGISVGDPASRAYLDTLCHKTGLPEDEVQRRAARALHLIIHDYTRFHVETLDTFSVSVMRNLAKELSIGTNLNIDLDSSGALSEAVDTMISRLEQDDQVFSWLSTYILERIDEGGSWRVFDGIKTFAEQIFDEKFVEEGETLRMQLTQPDKIRLFKQEVSQLKAQTEASLRSLAEQFLEVGLQSIQGVELTKKQLNVLTTYFKNLRKGKYTWAFADGLTKLIEEKSVPLLLQAEGLRSAYLSCHYSLKKFNDLCLLSAIDLQLSTLDKENNRFLLANVNKLLRRFVTDDDAPFVLEKMGTNITHVMMDEFQDTSRLQWKNFRPLLVEGLSQGEDSLIVGDVKQSIYRWRSSDWNILNSELRERLENFPILSESLKTNRRSTRNIIEFNNDVFVRATDVLNRQQAKVWGEESETLKTAYDDVEQDILSPTDRGYIRVEFLPSRGEEDASYDLQTLEQLALQVGYLRDKGVREKDIAILVRRGKHIKLIAEYFSQHTSFHLVSDEAFRLDASSVVNIIVDALRCLTLESLTQAKSKLLVATLALRYQTNVLHTSDSLNTILLASADTLPERFLPHEFTEHIHELSMTPLYELVERIYTVFHLADIDLQGGYVCAFLDAVADYCSSHPSDIASFVTYWEETLFKKTIPVGEIDGIRILTIHKSKGLEFHSVLLPFCDWRLEVENAQNPPKMWCHPDKAPFSTLDLLPIEYNKNLRYSVYNDDYRHEQLQLWVDNLNLLYVAFTRAKENLFVWTKMPSPSVRSSMGSVSPLLFEALSLSEGGTLYEKGSLQEAVYDEEKTVTNRLLAPSRAVPLAKTGESATFEFRQSNRSVEFFSDEQSTSRMQRGTLLHHLFECIPTRGDVATAIERLRMEGMLESQAQADELYAFATKTLDGFARREWFDGSWQLFNECSIVFLADGKPTTRRPDRVMMKDGAVVVLDYKFARKRGEHHQQVREYMHLLNEMGYSDVRGYLWYFDLEKETNELEEVRNG